MALLHKFPESNLEVPRRRSRVSRKTLLLIVLVSAAFWATLILFALRYL
jgi:hypothetical protein